MNAKHLDIIKGQYEQTIQELVTELHEISKEAPLLDITSIEILDNEERSLWRSFMSIATSYSYSLRSSNLDTDEVLRECIEHAIKQYKKEKKSALLLEEMRKELLSLPSLTNELNSLIDGCNVPVVESAAEFLIDRWQQIILKQDETHDFHADGKDVGRAIARWSGQAEPIIKQYAAQIATL